MPRQTSAERTKKLVDDEGEGARNLVTWSVPIANLGLIRRHKQRLTLLVGAIATADIGKTRVRKVVKPKPLTLSKERNLLLAVCP